NSEGLDDYWVFKTTAAILGVSQNTFGPKLNAYPNPNNGKFTINLGESSSETTVTIYNMLGLLISTTNSKNAQTLDVEINGTTGIYLTNVKNAEGKQATLTLTKR